MSKTIKSVLYAFGFAVAALMLANLIYFIVELYTNGTTENWSYKWNKGVFYKNNSPIGVEFGSKKGNGLMLITFAYFLFRSWRKNKLTS